MQFSPQESRRERDRRLDIQINESRRRNATRANHSRAVSLYTGRIHAEITGAAVKLAPMGSFVVPVEKQHQWTREEQAFFNWRMTPIQDRSPPTFDGFCSKVRHDREVIETWSLDPRVIKEFQRRAKADLMYKRSEVDYALVATASMVGREGDSARRLYKEEAGDVANYQIAAMKAGLSSGAQAAGQIGAELIAGFLSHVRSSKILGEAVEAERRVKTEDGIEVALNGRHIERAQEAILVEPGIGDTPGTPEGDRDDSGEG